MTFNRPDRLVSTFKESDAALSGPDYAVVAASIDARSNVDSLDAPIEIAAIPVTGAFSDPESASTPKYATNRVLRVDGQIWWLQNGTVNRFNNGTTLISDDATEDPSKGTWSRNLVFADYTLDSSNNIGLYPLTHNGRSYIVTAHQINNTSDWVPIRYDVANDVWESGAIVSAHALGASEAPYVEVEVDNKVYFALSRSDIYYLTPDLEIFPLDVPSTVAFPIDFARFKGKTYMLANDTGDDHCVYMVEGNGVSEQQVMLPGSVLVGIGENTRSVLYTDRSTVIDGDPKMYALYPSGSPATWLLAEMEDTGSGLAFTRRLELLSTTDENLGSEGRYTAHLNATSLLEGSGNEVDSYEIHRRESNQDFVEWASLVWRGADSSPTGLGFAVAQRRSGEGEFDTGPGTGFDELPAVHWALPHEKGGGGGRWYPGTNINLPTIDVTVLSGVIDIENSRVDLYWKLQTSRLHHNGTRARVKFLYEEGLGDAPNKRCTLTNPSHGTINSLGDNAIVANSGDVYRVSWDLAADAFPNLTRARLAAVIDVRAI